MCIPVPAAGNGRGENAIAQAKDCLPSKDFRSACSRFPTGVVVLTALGDHGEPYGITISSFTSVSLNPPLILVCIDHRSRILEYLAMNRPFGLSILGEHQRHLSVQFSNAWNDRFLNVAWYRGDTGVPLLQEVAAVLECNTSQRVAAGDHMIVVGEVHKAAISDKYPLIYFNSSYSELAPTGDVDNLHNEAPKTSWKEGA